MTSLSGVAALSPSNAWTVGTYLTGGGFRTLIAHWDGASWRIVPSPNVGAGENTLTAVAARSATDIWAVGYRNQVSMARERTLAEHWNGTRWQVIPSPNAGTTGSALFGVAVAPESGAWAVGNESNADGSTLAEHWNGSAWSVVPTSNQGDGARFLRAVAAPSARQAFAVGSYEQRRGAGTQDLAERLVRSRWLRAATPHPGRRFNSLQAVVARGATLAWAVGSTRSGEPGRFRTLAERWNGARWRAAETPSPGSGTDALAGLAAVPHRGGFWAVGNAARRTLIEFHC